MRILVTGGAGYIGSHATLRLAEEGHDVTVVDNLSRGHAAAIGIVIAAFGDERIKFVELDLANTSAIHQLSDLCRARRIDAVLHFAGLAYVGESVDEPLRYWTANLGGTIGLLAAMAAASVERIVFSSTCATYGEPSPELIPIAENCPQRPVNPYGHSKLAVERLLEDERIAGQRRGRGFGYTRLRYFNVAGCDRAARLGEDHRPETHLIPIALDAALGLRPSLSIFGDDYATPDGTCVRDYVHVDDLIDAHLLALGATRPGSANDWNIGMGRGHSVREVVESVKRVTGVAIPTTTAPRRTGDSPTLYADASKIRRELGWTPRVESLDEIVESAWRWRRAHPRGYALL
jgi:UDP-glucose 4-epimerase